MIHIFMLVQSSKPCQAVFKHVLREIGFKPEEAVFVDDIAEYVNSAKELGIHGIQFASRQALETELQQLGVKF